MIEVTTAAVAARPCPHCHAHRNQPCWSQFLDREMVNEVHTERRPASRYTDDFKRARGVISLSAPAEVLIRRSR